jgi:hypothetical protein
MITIVLLVGFDTVNLKPRKLISNFSWTFIFLGPFGCLFITGTKLQQVKIMVLVLSCINLV